MIRLYIADDHKMIRDGIKAMVAHYPDLKIVGEGKNGVEVLDFLGGESEVDVLMIDINMPEMDGIQCTAKVNKEFPSVKVLALSMNSDKHSITKVMKAGALGYILKDASEDELYNAITTVNQGQSFFSKQVTETMMSSLVNVAGKTGQVSKSSELSAREIEIIKHISDGLTNAEIGERLFISPRTVDTHRRNLLLKTGAKNSAELVKYAVVKGLLDFEGDT